jgi:uncharacterized protein
MFWRKAFWHMACVLVPLTLSAGAQAQSFNCNTADRPDEVLICQNPRLSALDERLSSLYFRLRNTLAGGERARLEADQAAWLRDRYSCGRDYGCIRGLYESRIAQLSRY